MQTQQDKNLRLKQIYSQLDRKFEEEETMRKAFEQGMDYLNLYGFPIDAQAVSAILQEEAEAYGAVVFFKEGRSLKMGITGLAESVAPLLTKLKDQSYYITLFYISNSSFKHALGYYSKTIRTKQKAKDIKILSTDNRLELKTLQHLSHLAVEESASDVIELILGVALKMNSSDVHLEPQGKQVKVRFRVDGVLQDVGSFQREVHQHLVSRIKILSKMKLNITTTPQDGSFSLTYDAQPVDIRVSVLPSAFGESIVMRLLRQDKGNLNFEDLGIMGGALEILKHELDKPNGMVLTTGPTGSGKTTTLYAMLSRLNTPGIKIITLEDPVEYKIPGITQTPIDARAGMTFASALRAILRQDPDIVMVGEMRDLETAEIAAQAALTGHIVLSTMHTNDAAGAIPRLLDLGVKPFVLAPAINAVIAQRLVRRICQKCKQKYEPQKGLVDRVKLILSRVPPKAKMVVPQELEFYHSPGCSECHNLGYLGQMGVFEVFAINEKIEKLIIKGATTTEIKEQAVSDGMLTLAQDGILKALQGLTDLEEVFRVTEE